MGAFTYSDLVSLDLGKLNSAAADWKSMVGELAKIREDARDGLLKKSEQARWEGLDATVTREFVRKTAKEFDDLYLEAQSVHSVLSDAHTELSRIQKRAKDLADEARRGAPDRLPEPDPSLLVLDGDNGTVRVVEAVCDAKGTSQRTKDRMQWYADTLTGLVAHAAEVDAAVTRALKKSHGGDPYNAGHARYTSLDEDQLPRAVKLASLGEDANDKQRAELRRLWQSLSPEARAQLWMKHKDDLLAAGLLSPTVKRIAPDRGSGPHGVKEPGWDEFATNQKMQLLIEGADWKGMGDAARHMSHYLGNSGDFMELPVDKMLSDDEGFRNHVEDEVRAHQGKWREQALEEFRRNGGQPVAIPVETANKDYRFTQEGNENWYFAVGSTRSNVTGVVTVVPGINGEPKVDLDYQANAWDRYNWDEGKGVDIYGISIPDGQMGRQHTVGLAQEFDMAGSSSIKHHSLDDPTLAMPGPDDPGRDGGRTDPTREQRQEREGVGR